MKIVFFGTPQFAADTLKYLLENKVDVDAVITKPDKPKGRSGTPVSTPVKSVAQSHNPPIPVYQPEKVSAPEFADTLRSFQADLFVVVAYGEIIKQHVLDMPKRGCINVHASILPKYRGAAPIQHSIIDGEKETGVTIMHMALKMDAGNIIEIVKTPIGPEMTAGELEKKLCEIGSRALLNVIRDYEKGSVRDYEQDHDKATYVHKIELEDCEIHWDRPAQMIDCLIRGVTPEPGAWCYVQVKGEKKRLKILKARIIEGKNGKPGEILSTGKEGVIVACQDGALSLIDLQLEGKKAMKADELLRGTPLSF